MSSELDDSDLDQLNEETLVKSRLRLRSKDAPTPSESEDNTCYVLVNNALAFTWGFMQKLAGDKAADHLAMKFSLEEVKEAKDLLWNSCPLLEKKIGRKESKDRSDVLAHARDIMKALHDLDSQSKVPMIAANALELHKLPPLDSPQVLPTSAASVDGENDGIEVRLSRVEELLRTLIAKQSTHVDAANKSSYGAMAAGAGNSTHPEHKVQSSKLRSLESG